MELKFKLVYKTIVDKYLLFLRIILFNKNQTEESLIRFNRMPKKNNPQKIYGIKLILRIISCEGFE